MSEIQVPQLSLWRYVDLLKRRRWQVIPVSLLGLVIGGLVAFFIPRYYVAESLIVHQQVPGQDLSKNVDDPFRGIVESALLTIPQAALSAMKQLGWEQALVDDPYALNENVRAVQARIAPVDHDKYRAKDRTYAEISVTYRDRDGVRAANYLNTLVEVWIDEQIEAMRLPNQERRDRANDEVLRQSQVYEKLLEEKYRLESDYQIAPDLDPVIQRGLLAEREKEAKGIRDKLVEKQMARLALAHAIEIAREALAKIERRVAPDPELWAKQALALPGGAKVIGLINYSREKMAGFQDWTEEYASAAREVKTLEVQLQLLVGPTAAEADGLVENPAYALQLQVVQKLEQSLVELDAEIAAQQKRIDDTVAGMARLAEGLKRYLQKLSDIRDAEEMRNAARERLRDASEVLAKIGNQRTIEQRVRATVPPRPTEPNILLVALIGCMLGLGIAIGLILLLDVLQGSFKTVDDVERGLAVPVLGGMSHLETEAERDHAVRSRRRVALIAATFVFLLVVVVTIFYVDPTRLPPVVRDLLSMLLGN